MLDLLIGLLLLQTICINPSSLQTEVGATNSECYRTITLGGDTVCTDCRDYSKVPIDGKCVPNESGICIIPSGYTSSCSACTSGYILFEDGCYNPDGKYAPLICAVENRYIIEGAVYCSKCAYLDYVPVDGSCDSGSFTNTCSQNVCTSCGYGYFLFNNGCVRTNSALGKLVCAGVAKDGKCTQCADGFSADSTGMCVHCTVTHCSSCPSGQDTCSTCKEGFYLSAGVCKLCRNHCSVCSSDNDCSKCRMNAHELIVGSEKVCIGCGDINSQHGGYIGIQFCSQCTLPPTPGAVQCQKCLPNYYSLTDPKTSFLTCHATCPAGTYGESYSKVCRNCSQNCLVCQNSYGCDECAPGYYASFSGCTPCKTPGCSKCIERYTDVICEMCAPETPYMNLVGTECIATCPEGSSPEQGTPTRCVCNFGYGLTETRDACVKCNDKYCKICAENPDICTECLYGSKTNGAPECPPPVCAANCKSCSNSGHGLCDICQKGFRLTTESKCEKCTDQNCLECTDSAAICTSCKHGFRVSSDVCVQCGHECKTCDESSCLECTNSVNFISIDGISCTVECPVHSKIVSENGSPRCVCNDGYIPELETKICVEEPKICPLGCICEAAPLCSGCADGFYEQDPTKTDSSRCHSCALATDSHGDKTVTGCKICKSVDNTLICKECLLDYKIYDSNGVILCMKTCPSGTHDTGSHCISCTVSDCAQCSVDKAICEVCNRGHYLWNSECISCNSFECAECGILNTCTKCMNTEKCNACDISHCRSCNESRECTFCENGFYGPTCQPCADNCLMCSQENPGICLKCRAGAIMSLGRCYNICTEGDGNGKCAPGSCDSRTGTCMRCSVSSEFPINGECISNSHGNTCSSGICTGCTDGYFIHRNGCYSLTGLPGNGICTSSVNGRCTVCQDGYSLQGSECVPCVVSGCAKCASDPTICELCAIQTHVVDPAGSTCVPSCATSGFGVDPMSKHCILCNDKNCLDCSGVANKCDRCKEGYYSVGGTCMACHETCLTCSGLGESNCLTCVKGKVHSTGSGLGGCIDECIANSRHCLVCNAIIFGTAYCSQCASGYYSVNGDCRMTARTLVCLNGKNGVCISCAPGYFLYAGGCYQLERLPGSYVCEKLAIGGESGKCSKCRPGYAPLSGSCVPCEVLNCHICEYNSNICTVCTDGYYGNNCDPCPETCASCNNLLQCNRCAAGYFAATDYETFNPSYCITCSDVKGKNGYTGKSGCALCVGPMSPGPILCLSDTNTKPDAYEGSDSDNSLSLTIGVSVTVVVLLLIVFGVLLWKLLAVRKRNRSKSTYLHASTSELLSGNPVANQSTMFDSISISIN